MNGKLGSSAIALVLLTGVGCMTCRHKGYEASIHPMSEPAFPPPVRAQVYLFMMNGHDITECAGMLGLRDALCEAGYAKVYYAQRQDKDWYYRELRRLRFDEPDARIVMLSYGSAADRVLTLSRDAVRDGIPIDSVVLLDPVGVAGNLPETLPTHSVVVRSHHWAGGWNLTGHENVRMDRVGHLSLPTQSGTIELVAGLLTASASRVQLEDIRLLPHLPLTDRPSPTPRPVVAVTVPQPEWDFLRPGALEPIIPPLPLTSRSVDGPQPGPTLIPEIPSPAPKRGPPLIPLKVK